MFHFILCFRLHTLKMGLFEYGNPGRKYILEVNFNNIRLLLEVGIMIIDPQNVTDSND